MLRSSFVKSPRDVELPADVSGDVELGKNLDVAAPPGLDELTAWLRRFHIRDVPTTILLALTGYELARIRGAGTDLSGLLQGP